MRRTFDNSNTEPPAPPGNFRQGSQGSLGLPEPASTATNSDRSRPTLPKVEEDVSNGRDFPKYYHSSEPSLERNVISLSEGRNPITSASVDGTVWTTPIGFGSVHWGKKHYKREASKRRMQAAMERSLNASSSSTSSPFSLRREASVAQSTLGESRPLMPDRSSDADNKDDGNNGDDEDDDGPEVKPSVYHVLYDMVFGTYVSILFISMPFATLANIMQWGPLWIFWLNFLTMIPLAALLGDFTQEVAAHTNQVIGGLINATFGNTVEVIVGIQALLSGQYRVVQASLLGSIFSNLLLVLGCCFFFGGLTKKEQVFNGTAATANMSLLALSSIALVLPTPFASYYIIADVQVLEISRAAAIFLMFMYLQLLYFQLRTHAFLFEDEDDDAAELSLTVAMIGLLVVTILITFFSGYLVASINGFVAHTGVSPTFVGLIILPIVGNAVEHVTAVTVAIKDKMDLAMGVAVGSCTQISLFVVPLVVLVGWACNKDMTLNFPHFEIILYVLAILTVSIILAHPKSNWLEGSLMITTYVMIAIGFWYEKVHGYTATAAPSVGAVGP